MRPVAKQYKMHFGWNELYPSDLKYLTEDGRHKGQDWLTEIGVNCCASVDGILNFKGYKRGFGNCIYIKFWVGNMFNKKEYRFILAHLSKIFIEKEIGAKVSKYENVALTGDSGMATGHPHLHTQVDQNIKGIWTPIDPSFVTGVFKNETV